MKLICKLDNANQQGKKNYLELVGKTGILHGVKSLNPFLIPYAKVYIVWINDLNMKDENYKINRRIYRRIPDQPECEEQLCIEHCKSTNHKERKIAYLTISNQRHISMKDTNKGNRWLQAEKKFLVLRTRSKYMKCAKSCLKIKTVNSG